MKQIEKLGWYVADEKASTLVKFLIPLDPWWQQSYENLKLLLLSVTHGAKYDSLVTFMEIAKYQKVINNMGYLCKIWR